MHHKKYRKQPLLKKAQSQFLQLAMALFFAGCCASISFAQDIPQSQSQINLTFAPLVKLVRPSVVNVYAARLVRQNSSPFFADPFFEQFFNRFNRGQSQTRISRSLGSGVIVRDDGIVITNFHVIRGANEVKVALYDGREFEAEIIFTDEESDLAILLLEGNDNFSALPLGNSENLEVGDLVLAIGNPFGVGQTVTSGIVSALARAQGGVNDFGFFIQTDASINPGNSGGALVDMQGQLVGINTSIFTRSGGSNGIGFAVPSNMVQVAIDSVEAGSKILLRPWLGAQYNEITSDIAQAVGLQRPQGALVSYIENEAPADLAGLMVGDIILELDSYNVPHVNSLGYLLATAGIGKKVDLKILRDDAEKTLSLELIAPPEVPTRDVREITDSALQGAKIANLSPLLAVEEGFDRFQKGVVILELAQNSRSVRFGVRRGDIILSLDENEMKNTKDVIDYLAAGNFSQIKINRSGKIITHVLR